MTFVFLGLALAVSVHLLTAGAISLALAVALPSLELRLRGLAAGPRAFRLLVAALLPGAAGLLVVLGLVVPAWLRHESRDTQEDAGLALLFLSASGAGLVTWRFGRALYDEWRTRRLVDGWTRDGRELPGQPFTATAVALDFPVAALRGVFHPRLILSESLLAALAPDELEAVVEHERAHVTARENLKRFLLRASPDPLALFPAGVRLRAAFEAAAEEAADRAACAHVSPLLLARTLLKVAALVPSGRPTEMAAAALHREHMVEARVRALVAQADASPADDPAPAGASPRLAWGLALLALPAVAIVTGEGVLPGVHGLLEVLVHLF